MSDTPRDGVGKAARFGDIHGMVGDADALYVTDGSLLRKVDLATAAVTTLMAPASWSGKPNATAQNGALGAIMSRDHRLYAVDTGKSEQSAGGQSLQTVWRYDLATGTVAKLGLGPPGVTGLCFDADPQLAAIPGSYKFLAGDALFSSWSQPGDGYSEQAPFAAPQGIWCAPDGSVYIADTGDSEIEEIPLHDKPRTLAGAVAGQGTDTAGPYMRLPEPTGLSSNAAGDVAVFPPLAIVRADDFSTVERYDIPNDTIAMGSDDKLYYVKRIGQGDGQLDELDLGTGDVSPVSGYIPGKADSIAYGGVSYLAYDGVGSLYLVGDLASYGLWRVDPSNGDSELILSDLPFQVMVVDGTRQIFGASSKNDAGEWKLGSEWRLGRLDLSTHQLTWLPTPPDGWEPSALAYDPAGILYVAEEYRQRVRGLVLATGKVFDLVGKPGEKGLRTGPLATARLNGPTALAILPNGALAIADGPENTVVVAR